MDIVEIFKDSFVYPTKNMKTFAIIGILVVLGNFSDAFDYGLLNGGTFIVGIIFTILFIAISLLILPGYFLSVIRRTVNDSNDLPSLSLVKNIIDSLKLLIMGIVYMIPIAIILLVSAFALNIFGLINRVLFYVNNYGADYANYMPDDLLISFGTGILIMGIIFFILCVLYSIIVFIAQSRLAKYDSLKSSFQIREIFNDISKIGWGNYIIWLVLLAIIVVIFAIIYATISVLGVIFFIIAAFFINTYLQIFIARNTGLIYKKALE